MSKSKKKTKSASRTTRSRKPPFKDAPQPRHVVQVPLSAAELQPSLNTLRDPSQPLEQRLEALQQVQAASFAIADFDSVRPEYIAALRQAAADQNPELRQRALGILAREHDAFAQETLLEGLRNPRTALVEPDKALQLLSYDPHAGVYPIAHEMIENSDDESVRREALRVLAGDTTAAPLLERILADKSEPPDIRRMSASALHALNPDRLQRWANKAVQDPAEDPEIVATSLTALTQFGDAESISGDKPLRKRVNQLQARGPAKIKKLAKGFVQKYDPES